jgi:hypothetical protein
MSIESLEDCFTKLNLDDEQEYIDIALKLRNKVCGVTRCTKEQNIVRKCLLCKYYLSSNEWSVLLEKHIKELFKISKSVNNTSGDGCSMNNLNIEIKVSLGTKDGTMNFVQLRPDHDINYYLLLAYDVSVENYGKVYWFLCKPDDLYELLPTYGGYAHGSIERLGKITKDNIKGRNCEYALRPNPYKNGKPKQLWDLMIENYQSTEETIRETLCV